MKRVAVACGGRSLERSISLHSGRRAGRALAALGAEVKVVDVDAAFVRFVLDWRPDYVFIAMHGIGGEDGTVQDLLEILEIPYTGSDAIASALCLDKHLFKAVCVLEQVPTPPWHSFTREAFEAYGAASALAGLMRQFAGGVVVKPARQGSSMGISVVHEEGDLRDAILEAMNYDDRILLERYVDGRELTVGILDDEALAVGEIITRTGPIFDYAAKYQTGGAEEIFPAKLTRDQTARAQDLALRVHRALKLDTYSRVDFRMDAAGELWCLEVNTLPGLTAASLLPRAAAAVGIGFPELCERICRGALARRSARPR